MADVIEMPARVTFARVKALEIDAEQIIAMFKVGDGRAVTFRGMPADARAVGMRGMAKFGKVVLMIESAEFPTVDVSPGAALLSLDIEARTVRLRAPEQGKQVCHGCGGPTYESTATGIRMLACDACQRAWEPD